MFLLFAGFCITAWTIEAVGFSIKMSLKSDFQVILADTLISTAFSCKPIFNVAVRNARDSMVEQGLRIGLDWKANVAEYESSMALLQNEFDSLLTQTLKPVEYPDYYLKPFHAYEEGNMSWKAATEVESAAITVHSHIFCNPDGGRKNARFDGDFVLRDNFHQNMFKIFKEKGFHPNSILDLGCSTGLSTLKLHYSFPEAYITGIDLSPYFIAGESLNDVCTLHHISFRYAYLVLGTINPHIFTSGEV
jgi:hypothetical protein